MNGTFRVLRLLVHFALPFTEHSISICKVRKRFFMKNESLSKLRAPHKSQFHPLGKIERRRNGLVESRPRHSSWRSSEGSLSHCFWSFFFSDEGRTVDTEVVQKVRGSVGGATQGDLEHFPVSGIRGRTGPAAGTKLHFLGAIEAASGGGVCSLSGEDQPKTTF